MIFSSNLADIVDLMVFATGISIPSAARLPLPLVFILSEEGVVVVEDEEELLEDDDDDDEDVEEESESESESIGCPWMLPVGEVDAV